MSPTKCNKRPLLNVINVPYLATTRGEVGPKLKLFRIWGGTLSDTLQQVTPSRFACSTRGCSNDLSVHTFKSTEKAYKEYYYVNITITGSITYADELPRVQLLLLFQRTPILFAGRLIVHRHQII